MASPSRRMVASVLFVALLLLVASEMGTMKVAEAMRHCVSQSHKFKGVCMSSTNCQHVCHNEGFQWGECRTDHVQRKCYCKKIC